MTGLDADLCFDSHQAGTPSNRWCLTLALAFARCRNSTWRWQVRYDTLHLGRFEAAAQVLVRRISSLASGAARN